MSRSLGRIVTHLAEPDDNLPPDMVALINNNVHPPVELTEADVYVRAMYIVSDGVNSFGGRFPEEEHYNLTELLIDSPVLIGHRKDQLPVGRTFQAETVTRNGAPWVKSYFYWLRSTKNADQLRDNIDGGVYKECSIAFTFHFPECSICGQDIRKCDHEPFEEYQAGGGTAACHFNYRQIDKVLESSLVYRGAIPHTSVTRDLLSIEGEIAVAAAETMLDDLDGLNDLSALASERTYLVVPRYDGLPVFVQTEEGRIKLVRTDGTQVHCRLPVGRKRPATDLAAPLYGKLVGYRGRERCSVEQLESYIQSRTGPVSRLVLHLFPRQGIIRLPWKAKSADLTIREMPNRFCSAPDLDRSAREIKTRDGVEVWSTETGGDFFDISRAVGYRYQPAQTETKIENTYSLKLTPNGHTARLILQGAVTNGLPVNQVMEITDFDLERLRVGGRFVARRVDSVNTDCSGLRCLGEGAVEGILAVGDGVQFETVGLLAGQWALRPIRLNGHDRYLIYNSSDRSGVTGEVARV